MAITIHDQPLSQTLARSPALYLISDDRTAADINVEFIARVFVWDNEYVGKPTEYIELKRLPNTSYSARFNTSNILRTYFEQIFRPTGLRSETMIFNTQIDFWYQSDTVTPDFNTPDETSSLIQFVDGYSSPHDGWNISNEFDRFLTDRPTKTNIPIDAYFSLGLRYDATSNIKVVYIENDLGESFEYDLLIEITPIEAANDNLIHCYTGGDVTQYGFDKLNTTWYFVEGRDDLDAAVTERYYFYITEPCKWGYQNISFVNKYGVWDYVQMWGRMDEKYKVDREEFMTSGLYEDEQNFVKWPDGQYRMTNTTAIDMYSMNTGFVPEQMSEVVKQLMLSETVRDADTQNPLTIESKGMEYKVKPNNRMINYTINFKSAFSTINSLS